MPVTPPVGKARDRSFIATARRAQIIAATIETIAEFGYGQASFGRIAERAGLSSTRLISYHFAGKQELIAQTVDEVVGEIGAFVGARMADQTSVAGALRAYIEANVEYVAGHRAEMKALLGIFLSGALPASPVAAESGPAVAVAHLEELLRAGQRSGEFRAFDVTVIATSIQRTIEGVPMLAESHPDLDFTACARELATMFDLATRNPA
jgi:AcrR family transcriptional regulator